MKTLRVQQKQQDETTHMKTLIQEMQQQQREETKQMMEDFWKVMTDMIVDCVPWQERDGAGLMGGFLRSGVLHFKRQYQYPEYIGA